MSTNIYAANTDEQQEEVKMQRKWMTGIVLGLCAWVLGASSVWADQANREAVVTSATGQVEWLKSGEADWKIAAAGQKLGIGDKVRTGKKSEALLTLDDESKITLSAGSEFSIQSLIKNTSTEELETVLALMKGKLRSEVTPLKGNSKFEIETPAVVAAVRGTVLGISINPDGTISVGCDSGKVELDHKGENHFTALLDNGDEAEIDYNETTGVIKITSVKGSFDVKGPDGETKTLNEGDSVTFGKGPATFVPATTDTLNAPVTDTQNEAASGSD